MPRLLSLLGLLLACTPLVGQITFGPELPLTSSPPEPVTAIAMIASNGAGYLVAWSGGFSTFVIPLGRDGRPLIPQGIAIDEPSAVGKQVAAIATDGTDYVIVTISSEGIVTTAVSGDPVPRAIAKTKIAAPKLGQTAALAFGGDRYLLVYKTGALQIAGVFLDRRGAPMSQSFIVDELGSAILSVASDGNSFVARDAAFTVAVSKDGNITQRSPIPAGTFRAIVPPSLIFAGHRYVLVWNDRSDTRDVVNEIPLDSSGVPDGDVTTLAVNSAVSAALATANGAVVLVHQYDQLGQISAVRLDADGHPLDAQPFAIISSAMGDSIDAAWNGSSAFAVWPRSSTEMLFGGELDLSGPPGRATAGTPLAAGAPPEGIGAIASTAHAQLLVWQERALYATHLFDGFPSDERLPVSDGSQQYKTTTASDGTDFLVVWLEVLDVPTRLALRLRVFRRDGATQIKNVASGNFSEPFAIWTGAEYLVTWTRSFVRDDGAPDRELMAIRISRSGEPLEPEPRHITAAPDFTTANARIARTQRGLVALFLHGSPASYLLKYDIFAAAMSLSGEFASAPVQITNTDKDHSVTEFDFAAAPDGTVALTWSAIRLNPLHPYPIDRAGAILAPDFRPIRTFDFAPATTTAAVCWTARSFFVSWTTDQVYLARYAADGRDLAIGAATAPVAMTSGPEQKGAPFLTATEAGALLTYTRPLPKSSGTDYLRIVGRSIVDLPRRRLVTPR